MASPTSADVFGRHQRDVYRYLVRMTGRLDVADDLSQEVFLRIVRALQNGGTVGHERGWVFAIARNLLRDRHRALLSDPVGVDWLVEPAKGATQAVAFDLAEALRGLTSDDRDTFLLKEVGGFSYAEIAETCGCSVESVRSRLFRTRTQLRAALAPPR